MYEGGFLLTSPNEESGVLPQSAAQPHLDPEPDDTEALADDTKALITTEQGSRNEYGAIATNGLQKRSRTGGEEANTTPRTPRSGPASGMGKYLVGGKGNENQKLLMERSSDEREL